MTGGRRVLVVPTRVDLIDAALLSILMILALIGFRTTFSGSLYLLVGVIGLGLGLVIAHLSNVLRQPMIAVAAMTLVVFFLLGGAVALRGRAIAGIFPSGSTLHGLATQSVHGWKDLLTTLPPVDGSGPLLVLPYLLGLLGGVGGLCLARRTRSAFAPLVSPFSVLVLVILLGSQTPSAQTLQGGVFGAIALGWAALRAQRNQAPIQNGTGRWARLATVGVLLFVAGTGAVLVGPHVPGTSAHKRVVLRSYVDPPFDIGQYASPLAGFRKYTKATKWLYNKPLFAVHGLAPSTPIRIATLDDYNGITWTASNQPSIDGSVPDTFQRVGVDIDDPVAGHHVSYTVTVDKNYDDVWLPDAGMLQSLVFHGTNASTHANYFRYNLATGTGVVPGNLQPGDTYYVHAVLPSQPVLQHSDTVAASVGPAAAASAFLKSQATDWAGRSSDTTAQIFAVAAHLHAVGKYTDGEPPNQTYLPGHYRSRLLDFVNGAQVAGDDEQFAATFALMINQLGAPARVVFGATPAADGTVAGRNIHAWVEVERADGSWGQIPTQDFMNRNAHPSKQPPQQQQKAAGKLVPPPARGRPHSSLDDASDAGSRSLAKANHHTAASSAAGVPAWLIAGAKWVGTPLLIIGLICASIVGVKAMRRRRRRTRGTPASRFTHGWREVLDHARDLGSRLPGGATRKEQAALVTVHDVSALARMADAHVFGPVDPGDRDAEAFWREIDRTRKQMSGTVPRARRIRAALSLASFSRPASATGGGTA